MAIPQWVRQRLPQLPAMRGGGETGAAEAFRQQARLGEAVSETGRMFLDLLTGAENEAALSTAARMRDERMEKAFSDISAEPNPDRHRDIYETALKEIQAFQPAREVVAARWRQQNDERADWWIRRFNGMNQDARVRRLDGDTRANWQSAIQRSDPDALARTASERVAAGLWTPGQASLEREEAGRTIEWNAIQAAIDADPDAAVRGLADAKWLTAFPKIAADASALRDARRDAWAVKSQRDRVAAEEMQRAQAAGHIELRELFDRGELTPSMTRQYFNEGRLGAEARNDLERRMEVRAKAGQDQMHAATELKLWNALQGGTLTEQAIAAAANDGTLTPQNRDSLLTALRSRRPVVTDRQAMWDGNAAVDAFGRGEMTREQALSFIADRAGGLSTADLGELQRRIFDVDNAMRKQAAERQTEPAAAWRVREAVHAYRMGTATFEHANAVFWGNAAGLSDSDFSAGHTALLAAQRDVTEGKTDTNLERRRESGRIFLTNAFVAAGLVAATAGTTVPSGAEGLALLNKRLADLDRWYDANPAATAEKEADILNRLAAPDQWDAGGDRTFNERDREAIGHIDAMIGGEMMQWGMGGGGREGTYKLPEVRAEPIDQTPPTSQEDFARRIREFGSDADARRYYEKWRHLYREAP